jgi:hypothetical protein
MTMNMADDLWAWVTEEPTGDISLVGGFAIGLGHMPLIGRSEEHVRRLERIARAHAVETGQRVWLRQYSKVQDHEQVS